MIAAGMVAALARNPFAAVLVVTALAWFILEFRQSMGRRLDAVTTDRWSGLLINVAAIGGFAVAIVARNSLPAAAIQPGVPAGPLGLVLLWCGIALRSWSFRTLGRYFTFKVQTSTDQPVITSGPYRLLRHPSYAGMLLAVVGLGLLFDNWASVLGMTAVFAAGMVYRIRVEERALLDVLGDAYRRYAVTRKRVVPFVW